MIDFDDLTLAICRETTYHLDGDWESEETHIETLTISSLDELLELCINYNFTKMDVGQTLLSPRQKEALKTYSNYFADFSRFLTQEEVNLIKAECL